MQRGKMKRNLILFLSIILTAAILSACQGKPNISVELKDYSFSPQTWTVPAGKDVSLTINNSGSVGHEFVIMKVPVSGEFNDDDEGNVYWESEMDAGKSGTVTFTAPTTPGDYQVVCGLSGHMEQGMIGLLKVTGP
jgi:uncharacterized cupredoxin-like copper-binding protein